MWHQTFSKDVVESANQLYPAMLENPELRWGFIRKVYSIIAIQLLSIIAFGSAVVSYHPIAHFFTSSSGGLACSFILIFAPLLVLCHLCCYHQSHPVNYILLSIFTLALAFSVGLTCVFTSGKVIMESAIWTAALVISLTLYAFWAAKRGHDFNFLGPFLYWALFVLIISAIIQIFFPLGKIGVMIYGCLTSIVFYGYIVHDTDNVIKRYTYDRYIWAAVALYLDVINLFLSLLTVFRAVDNLACCMRSTSFYGDQNHVFFVSF